MKAEARGAVSGECTYFLYGHATSCPACHSESSSSSQMHQWTARTIEATLPCKRECMDQLTSERTSLFIPCACASGAKWTASSPTGVDHQYLSSCFSFIRRLTSSSMSKIKPFHESHYRTVLFPTPVAMFYAHVGTIRVLEPPPTSPRMRPSKPMAGPSTL